MNRPASGLPPQGLNNLFPAMSTLAEIEVAADQLPPEEKLNVSNLRIILKKAKWVIVPAFVPPKRKILERWRRSIIFPA